MGKPHSKSAAATNQVVENSSGTHIFELHMPSMGFSMATFGLILLCGFFLYLCFRALPRCCSQGGPLFSDIPLFHHRQANVSPQYSMGYPTPMSCHPGFHPYVSSPMGQPQFAFEEQTNFRYPRHQARRNRNYVPAADQADIEEFEEEEEEPKTNQKEEPAAKTKAKKSKASTSLIVRQSMLP